MTSSKTRKITVTGIETLWIQIFILLELFYEERARWVKSPKTQSEGMRVYKAALKTQCHIAKNTLL